MLNLFTGLQSVVCLTSVWGSAVQRGKTTPFSSLEVDLELLGQTSRRLRCRQLKVIYMKVAAFTKITQLHSDMFRNCKADQNQCNG